MAQTAQTIWITSVRVRKHCRNYELGTRHVANNARGVYAILNNSSSFVDLTFTFLKFRDERLIESSWTLIDFSSIIFY